MAATLELMAAGLPAQLARSLGLDAITTFSAAGTTAATATALTADFANVTVVPLNGGVRLQSEAQATGIAGVINSGANVLTLYPATGEKINGQAANAGIQIAPGKTAMGISSTGNWLFIVSA
jgi:hypothetical protein